MKKTFKCSCGIHLLEVSYEEVEKEKIPELFIAIYDIYNPKTGRKYKKPKSTGDVLFLNCINYAKEMELLMNFLDDITMAWAVRRNK